MISVALFLGLTTFFRSVVINYEVALSVAGMNCCERLTSTSFQNWSRSS